MNEQKTLKVKVYRFDPDNDTKPYYQDYDVPFQFDKMKILDVIRYIQENIDGSLSFTWDCRLWNCGLCGLTVNHKPCSACLMDVKNIVDGDKLLIEPLPSYPIIKDLVIDRTIEIEEMHKAGIKYDRHNGDYSLDQIPENMDPEEISFFRDWYLACIDCLVCSAACPAFINGYEFIGPHLSVRIAKYANHPKDEGDRAKQGFESGIFRCVNCRRCDVVCPLELNISYKTMEMLKSEAIEKGYTPPLVRDFLENIYKVGNPWGMSPYNRAKWSEGLGIERFDANKHDFLFYVGSTGSYDTRAQKITQSLAKLMLKAGLSFGILGDKEISDGNEVARMGEKGLFEEIVEKNIDLFNTEKVTKIITLSPHAYNVFKNDYPQFGGQYEVIHYTHLLKELLKKGQLVIKKDITEKITYHDPCLLGRYNDEYEAPREVLQAIPGLQLIEMDRNKENSFCCGGGGGNFFTGILDGKDAPSRKRIKEARATGARILAISCPICMTMFEDAIKSENLEETIVAKDISEILLEALG